MKRVSIVLTVYLFWMAPTLAGHELAPLEGNAPAPVFTLPDLQDQPHALEDYHGKVVLVNFWASWCPSCIYEMPDLKRLKQTLGNEPFEILAINVGEPKFKVWKFVRLVNFDLPVLLDAGKDLFQAWDLTVLPTTFVLDRNGRPRYQVQGAPQWNSDETMFIIRQLLQEEENTQ